MQVFETVNDRTKDLAASLWAWLSGQAGVTAQVPTSRWLLPGDEDQDTEGWANWIEPVLLDTTGTPSRGSGDARILIDIGIAVRPASGGIYKREAIADALVKVLAGARVTVNHTPDGVSFDEVGVVRLMDPRVVLSRGKVDGIYRGTVTVAGYLTPS